MVAILNEHDFLDMDNGDAYFVTSTFIHPEYNATGLFENDMMLFQINKNVTLSKYMTLNDGILLPEGVTSEVTVAGWGTIASNSTSSSLLLETTVDLVSSETCDEYLGTTEHPGKICAYREGTDACQGDSGMYENSLCRNGSTCCYFGTCGHVCLALQVNFFSFCWYSHFISCFFMCSTGMY